MKKVGLIAVSLVWFIVLTSCTFNSNVSGLLAGEAEATAEVEEMMLAMAENRESDAKAMMHPQATEKADAAINDARATLTSLMDFFIVFFLLLN